MKKYWVKRISFVLAAFLLLAVLPMSAMADKGTKPKTGVRVTGVKATGSDLARQTTGFSGAGHKKATPSNAEKESFPDGKAIDGLPKEKSGEAGLVNDRKPQETAAAVMPVPTAVQALKTEVWPTKEDLAGLWTIDDVTSYRFSKDGTGALILPEHKYPFGYRLKEDQLTLKFESGKINKAVFTITLEEDTLTMIREEDAGIAEFVLERADD